MAGGDELDKKVSRQSEQAIRDADVVLFVVDATVGVTDEDARVAQLLRSIDAPVLVVANKVDDQAREAMVWELLALGLGDPFAISALHGRGTGDLLDRIVSYFPELPDRDEDQARRRGVPGGLLGRARGSAQRRQVHAVQPTDRRRPLGGARHARHHP